LILGKSAWADRRSIPDQINFRLTRDAIEGIDAFAAQEPDKPGRTEAVRRIVRAWLVEHGFLGK
jgi:hypothetical protein